MTTHESFKRRVRERMARTGERYAAARRSLITPAPSSGNGWISQPEMSDEKVRESTGLGWDEWVARIDACPDREAGHAAIAAWVADHHEISGWWAQTVTVGYERITGLRVPGQMSDGTFSVSRSRTLDLDHDTFRKLLLDDAERAELVPGLELALRSRPGVKEPRFTITERLDDGTAADLGTLAIRTDQVGPRLRVTATHSKLATAAEAESWKEYWAEWLAALADS